MKKVISILIMLLFAHGGFPQGNEWVLKKDENEIKVYTRKVEGSNSDEFKGLVIFNAGIPVILEKLTDVEKMPQWAPNCKKVELLKKTESDQFLYIENSVPFPFQNRDLVYYFKTTYPNGTKNAKIMITGMPELIPPMEGIVRIPRSNGYCLLEYISENKTKVTYQLHTDPGGNIVAWLANQTIVDMAFGTLEELRKLVE